MYLFLLTYSNDISQCMYLHKTHKNNKILSSELFIDLEDLKEKTNKQVLFTYKVLKKYFLIA